MANTGFGKYHSMREVNPFASLDASSMTGNAVYGWVNPMKLNEVLCILKFELQGSLLFQHLIDIFNL